VVWQSHSLVLNARYAYHLLNGKLQILCGALRIFVKLNDNSDSNTICDDTSNWKSAKLWSKWSASKLRFNHPPSQVFTNDKAWHFAIYSQREHARENCWFEQILGRTDFMASKHKLFTLRFRSMLHDNYRTQWSKLGWVRWTSPGIINFLSENHWVLVLAS